MWIFLKNKIFAITLSFLHSTYKFHQAFAWTKMDVLFSADLWGLCEISLYTSLYSWMLYQVLCCSLYRESWVTFIYPILKKHPGKKYEAYLSLLLADQGSDVLTHVGWFYASVYNLGDANHNKQNKLRQVAEFQKILVVKILLKKM